MHDVIKYLNLDFNLFYMIIIIHYLLLLLHYFTLHYYDFKKLDFFIIVQKLIFV